MPHRLVRLPLASAFTPEQALLALRDDARPFALIGHWAGGGALVGSEPVRVQETGEDPFAVLDEVPQVEVDPADGEGVGGGWVGWLGYGAARWAERTVPQPPRPVPLPEASWGFYDHLLRLDGRGRWWFEALWSDEHAARLEQRLATLRARLEGADREPRAYAASAFRPVPSDGAHAAAVERCRAYIAAGDLYQANLTLRLEADLDGDAIDLFARTAAALRPARGAYLGDAGHQVASLSPELFLERRGRRVRTAPIKGTVRRTGDPAERERLAASAKDAAEHVMIVDLMRNDLGRVAAYGSVRAAGAPRAEEHPGVWHLVSDVTATLRPGVTDAGLLRATFPPGSVTGAPKVKALEVIATLESTGREVYTGAIGICSPVAGLELSVAIRTFEAARGKVWLGAGGGVVADSDPDAEVREAYVKAAPLLAAAGAVPAREGRPAGAVPPPVRAPRPDPAHGLLETVLAVGGRPVDLDDHVDRLRASAREVLGLDVGEDAVADAVAAVLGEGRQRIRIVLGPAGELTVTATGAAPLPRRPVTLVPVTVPGGAGAHKWADRRLLDAHAGDREALVVDLDGSALETGRGTLWIAEGDRLVTPPADGRLLDGTVRRRLLDDLAAHVEPLDLDRVRAAREVLVTSTIRGVQQARLEGARPPGPGEQHRRLAAHLAAAWGLAGAPAPV